MEKVEGSDKIPNHVDDLRITESLEESQESYLRIIITFKPSYFSGTLILARGLIFAKFNTR